MTSWKKLQTREDFMAYLKTRVRKNRYGCWLWIGPQTKYGYGNIAVRRKIWNGRFVRIFGAHRVSYYVFKGPIPKGKHVCHDCPVRDRKSCINPDHLHAWTTRKHGKDRKRKGQSLVSMRKIKKGNAKLTPLQVHKIIELYFGPTRPSQTFLAKKFKVSQATISNLVRNVSYRQIVSPLRSRRGNKAA
jgi:hypothetical protein